MLIPVYVARDRNLGIYQIHNSAMFVRSTTRPDYYGAKQGVIFADVGNVCSLDAVENQYPDRSIARKGDITSQPQCQTMETNRDRRVDGIFLTITL